MKKNSKNFLFGLAIVAIYLITVVALSLSLFAEFRSGPSRVEFRFTELVRETYRNLKNNKTKTDSFNSSFLKSLGDTGDLAGIQLLENGKVILSYPASVSSSVEFKSPLIETKSTVLKVSEGCDLTLTAAMYLVTPKSLSSKFFIALFVTLLAIMCCIFYLAIYISAEKKSKPEVKIVEDEGDGNPEDFFSDELFIEDSKKIENDLNNTEESPDSPQETVDVFDGSVEDAIENSVAEDDEKDSLSGDDSFVEDDEIDYEMDMSSLPIASNITQEEYQALTKDLIPENNFEEPVVLEIEKKELTEDQKVLKPLPVLESKKESDVPATVKRGVPEGLFSPVTGFGWEEYLLPRLDSELMRCASSDQDLALISIDIKDVDWSSESGVEICKLISDTFKFRDMIFEYRETGCIGIVLGLDSDGAVAKFENLHTDIISVLAQKKDYHIVSIGIANRNMRLISGSRLAEESKQALSRAMVDKESPIVAFRANPEKYRNFIAEETAKQELAQQIQES